MSTLPGRPRAEPVPADELDEVVALIVGEQQLVDRLVPSLGDRVEGVRAELDELDPPWAGTVRVVRDTSGALAGAVLVDWDDGIGRAWIHGPWVPGEDDRWDEVAPVLVQAAVAQLPDGIAQRELAGHVANHRVAALAAGLGWPATEVNHVLVADTAAAATWPVPPPGIVVRPVATDDLPLVRRLHDAEFPGTYASAEQVVAQGVSGAHVVLVAGRAGRDAEGYAAGRVQPDGEGYVDFVVVDPASQGSGVGRSLVVALGRALLERAGTGRVSLTVQDHRARARDLYERLGFREELALVAYRRPDP